MTDTKVIQSFERLFEGAETPDGTLPPEFVDVANEVAEALVVGMGVEIISSANEIAAYAEGKLRGQALVAFEAKLLASEELRDDVEMLRADLAAQGTGETVGDELSLAGLRASLEAHQPLTMEQQRALFTDATLRAEYNRLIKVERFAPPPRSSTSVLGAQGLAMPARAAASSDQAVSDRAFAGGTIHIGAAGRPTQFLIRIRFDDDAADFDLLELHGADGTLAFLLLPPPYDGEIERIVDVTDATLAEAMALLQDPTATGVFRSQRDFG
jgi:hypothetical protein